jgi:hypothetical protein
MESCFSIPICIPNICNSFSISPKFSVQELKKMPESIKFDDKDVYLDFDIQNVVKPKIPNVIGPRGRISNEVECDGCNYLSLSFKNSDLTKIIEIDKLVHIKSFFLVSENRILEIKEGKDIIETLYKGISFLEHEIYIKNIPRDIKINFIVIELLDENSKKIYLRSSFKA